jgi:hypothetical protein
MGIGASIGMIVLILDTKTVLSGARDGITLCAYTVIPSLFPFFLFSVLLNHILLSGDLRFLHPLGKLTGIPTGAEPLLLIGLIGGYPVGAQCISDAYRNKCISRTDAHRMLGFCSKLHTLRLDNCNNDTINKIITSSGLSTGTIKGVTRKIYCKEENAAGLTAPTNWIFEYID